MKTRIFFWLLLPWLLCAGLAVADGGWSNTGGRSDVSGFGKTLTDAFGRLRTSNPQTVFDFKRLYGTTNFYFQSITFGANAATTHDVSYSSTTLTSGSVAGGYAISQTRSYWHYQPGKGIRMMATGNLYGAVTGSAKRIGMFDANDGLFLELSGTAASLAFVQRSSTSGTPVDTKVVQASWNKDRLDGTGPSGITLDISKSFIFWFEQEWLGVGDTFFGFVIDGKFILCHQFNNTNRNIGVYTRTPQLPLRMEVSNWGTPPSLPRASTICWSLDADGGYNPTGREFDEVRATSVSSSTGVVVPVIAIRLKDAWKRGGLAPTAFWAVQSSNSNSVLEVWLCQGGAGIVGYSGLTFNSVDGPRTATESIMGGFTLLTYTTGVIRLASDGISNQTRSGGIVNMQPFFYAGADFDGVQDVIVLTIRGVSAASTLDCAGLGFREIY